jgi:hypothetical protein
LLKNEFNVHAICITKGIFDGTERHKKIMTKKLDEKIVNYKLFKIVSSISSTISSNSFTRKFLLNSLEKSFTFLEFFSEILSEVKDSFVNDLIKTKLDVRNDKYKIKVLNDQKMNMIVVMIKIFNSVDRYFIPKGVFEELKRSYEYLENHGKALNSEFDEGFNENVICLIYRYTTLWEYEEFLSKENLKILHEELGCNLECFSSPLYRTLEKYCSMFEDDKIFGSIGNFFTASFTSDSDTGISAEVNPPYIDQVIDRTLDRIFNLINSDIPCSFVLSLPRGREIDTRLIRNVIYKFEMLVKVNIYTRYLQRIELKKMLNVYIIQNNKGSIRYPVTERFKRRFMEYNEEYTNNAVINSIQRRYR